MLNIAEAVADLIEKGQSGRFVLGIVGPPGAGKSTLSEKLFAELEAVAPGLAVIVPMDGFHLDNQALDGMGLLPLKGVPASFDGAGFVALLRSIREGSLEPNTADIPVPKYDRSIESTVSAGDPVRPEHRIVLVEGNYLLLENEPWCAVRPLLDEVWYLHVPEDVLIPRLVTRHMAGGKNREQAVAKVNSTDLPNGRLVAASRFRADRVLGEK